MKGNGIFVARNYPKNARSKAITIFGEATGGLPAGRGGFQENCLTGEFAAKSHASSGQT
jgi:hypothetical protein